jgi:hypothetical protein
MTFFKRRLNHEARPRPIPSDEMSWEADPLSHPDLRKMSVDQLADLPFDPRRVRDR